MSSYSNCENKMELVYINEFTDNVVKNITIPNTYNELETEMLKLIDVNRNSFNIKNLNAYYLDDDNDPINVMSEDDYIEALNFLDQEKENNSNFKFKIFVSIKIKTPSIHQQSSYNLYTRVGNSNNFTNNYKDDDVNIYHYNTITGDNMINNLNLNNLNKEQEEYTNKSNTYDNANNEVSKYLNSSIYLDTYSNNYNNNNNNNNQSYYKDCNLVKNSNYKDINKMSNNSYNNFNSLNNSLKNRINNNQYTEENHDVYEDGQNDCVIDNKKVFTNSNTKEESNIEQTLKNNNYQEENISKLRTENEINNINLKSSLLMELNNLKKMQKDKELSELDSKKKLIAERIKHKAKQNINNKNSKKYFIYLKLFLKI